MSPKRLPKAVVVAAVAVLGLAACATSSSSAGTSKSSSSSQGTPVKGGTLNMLGSSDVDYMDPNITYTSTGDVVARLVSRQLYTNPADTKTSNSVVPDLATGAPQLSADGLTVTVKMRSGVMWETTPPRQVTAADVVRGVKRTCNPSQPFGGLPDYESLIVGFQSFCDGFAKVAQKAGPIANYQNSHDVAGVKVGSDPLTVVFTLTRPAGYVESMLSVDAFSPAPKEYDAYVPASAQLAQHIISDGPYKIDTYVPTKSLALSRNPAWNASTDPVRKAYVDKILIDETVTQESVQQQLQTASPKADMEFVSFPPPSEVPGLIAAKDPLFYRGSTSSSLPYLIFNTLSPNNQSAMKNVLFRRALQYGINRSDIIQAYGGPQLNRPLTHVLPPSIQGGQQDFDLYPTNQAKAKQLLTQAGVTKATLTFVYQSNSEGTRKAFAVLQNDLKPLGITVKGISVPYPENYTKYLQVPSAAKRGLWDIGIAGWGADWYGDAAITYFGPLLSGQPSFPPTGSNYGFYENPKTDMLIKQASAARTVASAPALWHHAAKQVMEDAAVFPITKPLQPGYSAKQVHNVQYLDKFQGYDPANVWLDPKVNAG